MSSTYWIIAGILAFAFFGSGMMKIVSSKHRLLKNKNMGWANDYTATQIKLIGLAEVLGAAGMILPQLLNIAPNLSKIAAICLHILMIGAANVHRKRQEPFIPALVLALGALTLFFML
jgi:hypothetical protein